MMRLGEFLWHEINRWTTWPWSVQCQLRPIYQHILHKGAAHDR